ncbi:MAG: phosphate starvation-inducible protein PsiF [Xanthomonadaceae bacterium]|nr:phosphate starvation-inducible protein PsiF [Xanthomonadaceae bacterium]MDE1963153.1 phosphate starvation-inducible protein PsiF [Xanthomonadaceae bacterium]
MGKPFRILFAAALTVAGALVVSTPAIAATGKPMTAQQHRMADCNKQASGKKGDERKAFMKSCLKGGAAAAPAKMTQQEKMKKCNADAKAKALKGDARKSFMSTCLKG